MSGFIELDRRFRDLTNEEHQDPSLLASLDGDFPHLHGWPWAKLLESYRVVILAEAGSGKTRELQAQAARLVDAGKPAFFIPIEELDQRSVEDVLAQDETLIAWFREWQAGDEDAFFFLDSVDELKLSNGSLGRAFGRAAAAIGAHGRRARVFVTCRPTDWQPVLDMESFRSKLPVPRDEKKAPPVGEEAFHAAFKEEKKEEQGGASESVQKERRVFLMPLAAKQIEAFAKGFGVSDPKPFLAEVGRQEAWPFVRRPADLLGKLKVWKDKGTLGTLRDQHEADITLSLEDDPERADRDLLTPEDVEQGAERVALAMFRTRHRTITVPENSLSSLTATDASLDATKVLKDWSTDKVKALLRRPLFDPATYDRVRFHHRSVQEYLAARRLKRLREEGLTARQLRSLLFVEKYGETVVIPSMKPIAAWLSASDADVANEVLRREPEILISHGDPATLPVDVRVRLVRSFVAAYGKGDWRGFRLGVTEVGRLAHPDLAAIIKECWASHPENDEVRDLLLRLVWLGRIQECIDIAAEVFLSPAAEPYSRIYAARALRECRRLDVLREGVNDIIAAPANWPDKTVYAIADDLFPGVVSVAELEVLIRQTNEPKQAADGFGWTLRLWADQAQPGSDASVSLREMLAKLVWDGRTTTEWHRPKSKFDYLVPALTVLCRRQLEAGIVDDKVIFAAALCRKFRDRDAGEAKGVGAIHAWMEGHPEHRETVFWTELALAEFSDPEANKEPTLPLHIVSHYGLFGSLISDDWDWLLKAAKAGEPEMRRVTAFYALMDVRRVRGNALDDVAVIRRVYADRTDLLAVLDAQLAPHEPNPVWEKMQADDEERRIKQAAKKAANRQSWDDWRAKALADPAAAFDGDEGEKTLWTIVNWMRNAPHNGNVLTLTNWPLVKDAFGEDLAGRFYTTMREYWRNHEPPLWRRRPPEEKSLITGSQTAALTGLAIEAGTRPGWASTLSPEDAQRASEWALLELNALPQWVSELVAAHPEDFKGVLLTEIQAESQNWTPGYHAHALQVVRNGSQVIKKLVAPDLKAMVMAWPKPPKDKVAHGQLLFRLRDVVAIIIGADIEIEPALVDEFERRFLADPTSISSAAWLNALAALDLSRAEPAVRNAMAKLSAKKRNSAAVSWIAALFNDRMFETIPVGLDTDAKVLLDLVRLAYDCVRREDDVTHEGVYSPDARDDAESARNRVLSALIEKPGQEAHAALLAMADEPLFKHIADRLRMMARERAAQDSEPDAIAPDDYRAWEIRYATKPKTREALFDVMRDRLEDIDHEIRHDDFTDRAQLQAIEIEADMQLQIARRLRDAARDQYKLTREEEVPDNKETDIRFHSTGSVHRGVIEIKIGDSGSSTVTTLEAAIAEQLTEQYLRHKDCTVGCLLVTYAGRKGFQHPTTAKAMSFAEVIEHLKAFAKDHVLAEGGRVLLDVVGLDLTSPLKGEEAKVERRAIARARRKAKAEGSPKPKPTPRKKKKSDPA